VDRSLCPKKTVYVRHSRAADRDLQRGLNRDDAYGHLPRQTYLVQTETTEVVAKAAWLKAGGVRPRAGADAGINR
jgi:hypothetical protein